jgi:hypothetical protein
MLRRPCQNRPPEDGREAGLAIRDFPCEPFSGSLGLKKRPRAD